ncbi:sugar phosphate nucleotidyltransferase [Bacillus sp. DX4.1]|uniref:sugar phosphate nucleotidyltransferase n=1 Tax=Bacillus sp. DX4.1 TaxID=3055867 RepID=UPI0025A0D981|nr:sugar phosphate nucleotidyltransferase [Bacillus sp. DX4.1]MDM5189979.1 sugar phosphate nucleotidyltransferase [Bacillus sp. DX4.1]
MKGVILAGGKGRRLRPLTCNLPKPMLPLIEKPVMEYSIELLKCHGIKEIAITVQYMSTAIQHYFGDGSKWGVKLHYFEDSPPLGTAGSIKQAEEFLDEPFVVISGDALTDFDLLEGIEFHQSSNRMVTMFVKEVPNPLSFGLVVMNEQHEIVRYIEKPSWNEVISNVVNTGIYIMNPEIFSYIPPEQFFDFSHHVFPLLENKKAMFGYVAQGYWLDIGTFEQYRQAQFDLLTKKVQVPISYTEVLPMVWMGEEVTIEKGTKIHGPAFIGERATIGAGVIIEPYSIIGKQSIIADYTHLKKSIVLSHTYVGKRCELLETTVGESTVIEEDVTLFEQSVIADRCRIGKNTVIKQNGKVWPYKVIDSHSIIASSGITERENTSGWLQKSRVVGRSNIEITPQVVVKVAMAYGSLFSKGERILVGSQTDVAADAYKKLFLHAIHSVGVDTMECQEMNDSAFRYTISELGCSGGVFVRQEQEEGIVIELYGRQGTRLSYKQQKEIEHLYMSESFHYVYNKEIGRNEVVHVCLEKYVEKVASYLDIASIQKQQFHLLVNKRDEMFQPLLLSFLQKLGCTITWIYADGQKDHIKLLMKSSRAHMALMVYEQGSTFELYDNQGKIYRNTNCEEIDVPDLLLETAECVYPLSLKLGECYLLFYMHNEKNESQTRWQQDILYRIGKLFELIARQGKTVSVMLEQSSPLYLLCDEVVCAWKEKGKVMGMLLQDMEKREVEILEGIQFKYTEKEWSYIVSDTKQPKFLVYSHARNPVIAKENMKTLIEKIRQYQKV